jgi:hypothetical protein
VVATSCGDTKQPATSLAGDERRALQQRLEFSVGVRADFAVQIDFFVLGGGPFHDEQLLVRFQKVRCRELRDGITGRGKSEYRGARFERGAGRGKSGFPVWEVGVSGTSKRGTRRKSDWRRGKSGSVAGWQLFETQSEPALPGEFRDAKLALEMHPNI